MAFVYVRNSRAVGRLAGLTIAFGLAVTLAAHGGGAAAQAESTPAPDASLAQATPTVPRPAPTATLTATISLTPTRSITATFPLVQTGDYDANFSPSTGSKLTLHFIGTTPATYQFLRDARPPFIKLVDDVGWSKTVRQDFPEMMMIGRSTTQYEAELRPLDPVRAAREYVRRHLALYQTHPDIEYWEGWNEPVPVTSDDWIWYAEFEGARACLMQQLGFKAVVGNFSTGTPEFRRMLLFVPALKAGAECGALFGLHEYSAPTMQYCFGWQIPHRPAYANRGCLTFRYRYWYEDILKPLNIAIPLVITEMGIDGGVGAGRPGPSTGGGWLDFGGYWEGRGLGSDYIRAYMDQLAWYDAGLRQDPYVLGATIFTTGGRSTGWATFDVDQLIPSLTQYAQSLKGR